jgi:hypothetical protein
VRSENYNVSTGDDPGASRFQSLLDRFYGVEGLLRNVVVDVVPLGNVPRRGRDQDRSITTLQRIFQLEQEKHF